MYSKTIDFMTCHALKGKEDGLVTHPRDSEAWKTFDLLHPKSADGHQNVRLSLATYGFNPFEIMSTSYSI